MIEKAKLKVTEARMEATLATIKHDGEVAAAIAETKVLEAAAESERGERISEPGGVSERVQAYIESQSQLGSTTPVGVEPYQPPGEPVIHVLGPGTPLRQHRSTARNVTAPGEMLNDDKTQQLQKSTPAVHHISPAPPFTFSPMTLSIETTTWMMSQGS